MSKGEDTKQKILQNALVLFSKQGYAQTSIRDIALKVKIKAPSIYAYFSSKEELFESVADDVMSDYLNFVRQKATDIIGLSKVDKLYTFTEQIIEYLYEKDLAYFVIRYSVDPPDQFKDAILQRFNEVDEEIKKLIRDIIKPELDNYINVETIISSFFCILDGLLLSIGNSSREECEIRLKATWDVFSRGINKNH
ncbi:DNA-binding transcriptional regulator, AcrR family [Fontibacillus panacisegetis]|uniref:DNA-binding transcriptional regulator, AcrR family n=1 Tax=Fontibacillus panacisegetis TaxID=670482 RepID=A0A1G7FWE5_9BACL|nr:TetR/AcrR family transcriptional regulator [Fontibacillus panacisegetis]SDE80214.1 DNA-binding transcriptional regulator, AcrR family [Fontibacillus panacisegetis]